MRDYGKLHTAFWTSESLHGLDVDSRLLAAYLLTGPHTTMLGAFRLPHAYVSHDLGWDSERLRNGFETLSEESCGFIEYDAKTGWVWIVKFLQFNRPENPNQWKAIAKQASAIPDSVMFKSKVLGTVLEPFRNSSVPVPVPVPVKPSEAAVDSFPLDDGSEFAVTETMLVEFRKAYPRIDVGAEVRKVRAWCVANPAQRKTRRGASKFLNGWLSRTHDKAPPESQANKPGGGRRAL